jgi:hypothetical protein
MVRRHVSDRESAARDRLWRHEKATGATAEECAAQMSAAIAFHIEAYGSLASRCHPPTSRATTVGVAAA